MTFTYTVGTSLGRLRSAIGDTASGSGPLPGATTNFTDEELNDLIATEGTWQKAVAGACEVLANRWATSVNFSADGLSVSRSDIARMWQSQAAEWRKKYGGGYRAGSTAVTKADGYSNDVTNVEV